MAAATRRPTHGPLGAVAGDCLDKPVSAGLAAMSHNSAAAALVALIVALSVFRTGRPGASIDRTAHRGLVDPAPVRSSLL
jgi:uncharacterized membrane-anchored protein